MLNDTGCFASAWNFLGTSQIIRVNQPNREPSLHGVLYFVQPMVLFIKVTSGRITASRWHCVYEKKHTCPRHQLVSKQSVLVVVIELSSSLQFCIRHS
jgi:hypothetical protein